MTVESNVSLVRLKTCEVASVALSEAEAKEATASSEAAEEKREGRCIFE